MKLRLLSFAAVPFVLFFAAACGDGDNPDPTPAPSPTRDASAFGPTPVLGGNILDITPKHASSVKQAATRSPNPNRPEGVCAKVDFKDLPDTGRWFRMALDETEVTTELTWIVSSNESPTGGIMCFAPEEGIPVGRHTAAVAVQDPNNPQAPTRQIVAWEFDVTE